MLYIIKFFYNTFLLPPSILIVALLLLCIWLYHREKTASKILLSIAFLLYFFSTPFAGEHLIHPLEYKYSPPATVQGDVIVWLGGGATADAPDISGRGQLSGSSTNRLLTAASIYKMTNLSIILSAGKVYKDSGNEAEIAKRQLRQLGIPENKIIIEDKSRNTTENAKYTSAIIQTRHFKQPILVTSAFHMERSIRNFNIFGIKVIPYPTDYNTNPKIINDSTAFIPSSFELSRIALKEYLGLLALSITH